MFSYTYKLLFVFLVITSCRTEKMKNEKRTIDSEEPDDDDQDNFDYIKHVLDSDNIEIRNIQQFQKGSDDDENPSISESLKFILDFHKKTIFCEKKLENVYKAWDILQEEKDYLRSVKARRQQTENLIQRTEMAIRRFRTKLITGKEYWKILSGLDAEHRDQMGRRLIEMQKISQNMTSMEDDLEIGEERNLYNEINNYSDMVIPLMAHLSNLKSHLKQRDEEINPFTDTRLRLNLDVFQELLEKYQKLDQLKQLLEEKYRNEKEKIEKDINLSKEIFLEELQKFEVESKKMNSRIGKKIAKLDHLKITVKKVQDEYIQVVEEYGILTTQLTDLLDNEADTFLEKMDKTEL